MKRISFVLAGIISCFFISSCGLQSQEGSINGSINTEVSQKTPDVVTIEEEKEISGDNVEAEKEEMKNASSAERVLPENEDSFAGVYTSSDELLVIAENGESQYTIIDFFNSPEEFKEHNFHGTRFEADEKNIVKIENSAIYIKYPILVTADGTVDDYDYYILNRTDHKLAVLYSEDSFDAVKELYQADFYSSCEELIGGKAEPDEFTLISKVSPDDALFERYSGKYHDDTNMVLIIEKSEQGGYSIVFGDVIAHSSNVVELEENHLYLRYPLMVYDDGYIRFEYYIFERDDQKITIYISDYKFGIKEKICEGKKY